MQWFRFYHEALTDPKVQQLPTEMFRRWINVLCIANMGKPRGRLPDVAAIAYHLRLSESETTETLGELRAAELLDDVDGRLVPHNWDKRQPEWDDATVRVQRHRGKQSRNVA